MSSKQNITTQTAKSAAQCGTNCEVIFGCGGFNIRTLPTGLLLCEFKQGVSTIDVIRQEYSVIYYEKQGL